MAESDTGAANHFWNHSRRRRAGPPRRARAYTPRSPNHRPANALKKAILGSSVAVAVRVAAVIVAPSSETNAPSMMANANASDPSPCMEMGNTSARGHRAVFERRGRHTKFSGNGNAEFVAE